jgi:hypothetical protein
VLLAHLAIEPGANVEFAVLVPDFSAMRQPQSSREKAARKGHLAGQ